MGHGRPCLEATVKLHGPGGCARLTLSCGCPPECWPRGACGPWGDAAGGAPLLPSRPPSRGFLTCRVKLMRDLIRSCDLVCVTVGLPRGPLWPSTWAPGAVPPSLCSCCFLRLKPETTLPGDVHPQEAFPAGAFSDGPLCAAGRGTASPGFAAAVGPPGPAPQAPEHPLRGPGRAGPPPAGLCAQTRLSVRGAFVTPQGGAVSAHPSAAHAPSAEHAVDLAPQWEACRGGAPALPLAAQWAQGGPRSSPPTMGASIHTPVASIPPGVCRKARVPNPQGPPVQHRELWSASCNNL